MSNTSTSASTGTENKITTGNGQVKGTTSSIDDTRTNITTGSIDTPVAKLAASRSMLSEDTRHKLENIVKELEEKPNKSGKFLKILDGELRTLLFDPDKFERLEITYPVKEGEKESNGSSNKPAKPTRRIKFLVREAHENGIVPDDSEEIEWTASETAGTDALKWILKGFFLLDVTRKGSTKLDTKYTISPHL